MKRTIIYLICLAFLIMTFACGRRTAPVPYDVSDISLPIVQMQKPVYKGDWLFISWSLDSSSLDSTPDVFTLNVFKKARSCRYCSNITIENIEISDKEFPQSEFMRFKKAEQTYGLYLEKTIHQKWQSEGLYNLAIYYRTESGLNAEQSNSVSPTLSNRVIKPEITNLQISEIEKTTEVSVFIQWKLVPEHVYRKISKSQASREVTQNFGLNLYVVKDIYSLQTESKLNSLPLMSGQVVIQIGEVALYARHIDRYGNESEKVFLVDNLAKKNKDDGIP